MALLRAFMVVVSTLFIVACGGGGDGSGDEAAAATTPADSGKATPPPAALDFPARALMLANLQSVTRETASASVEDLRGNTVMGELTLLRTVENNAMVARPVLTGQPVVPVPGTQVTESLMVSEENLGKRRPATLFHEFSSIYLDAANVELGRSYQDTLVRVEIGGQLPVTVQIGAEGDYLSGKLLTSGASAHEGDAVCGQVKGSYAVLPDTDTTALLRVTTTTETMGPDCGLNSSTEKVYRMSTAGLTLLRGKIVTARGQTITLTYR